MELKCSSGRPLTADADAQLIVTPPTTINKIYKIILTHTCHCLSHRNALSQPWDLLHRQVLTLLHPQLLLMQIHDQLTAHPWRYITYPAHVAQLFNIIHSTVLLYFVYITAHIKIAGNYLGFRGGSNLSEVCLWIALFCLFVTVSVCKPGIAAMWRIILLAWGCTPAWLQCGWI